MATLQEQIKQKEAELAELKNQLNDQTPADGYWNPADYVGQRYGDDENTSTLLGKSFNKNYDKIPDEAKKYIEGEIYKRQQSGYPVTKSFLRVLQYHVRGNPDWDVPDNWDISSFWSTDKGMARNINKQNKTQSARPETTVPQTQVKQNTNQNQNTNTQNTGTQTVQTTQATEPVDPAEEQRKRAYDQRMKDMAQAGAAQAGASTQSARDAEEQRKRAYDQGMKDMAETGAANEQAKAQAVKAQSEQIKTNTENDIGNAAQQAGSVDTSSVQQAPEQPVQSEPDYAALIAKITSYDDKDRANALVRRINFCKKEIEKVPAAGYSDEMVKTYTTEIESAKKQLNDIFKFYKLI